MGTIEPLLKKYYIMDTTDKYYRLDKIGQLVMADGKEDAVFFTYEDADKKIGNGKRSHYFKIVPTEMYQEKATQTQLCTEEADAPEQSPLSQIDWLVYLQNFNYIVANIEDYIKQLREALSKKDQALTDLLHYIEFYDLNEEQRNETITKIKTEREYRRDIKTEIHRAEEFIHSIGTNNNASLSTTAIRSIQRVEASEYHPRVLQDLFLNATDTHRKVVCFHDMAMRYETTEKGMVEEMERRNTIYDGVKMDWNLFVQRQVDFFSYAHQHIQNLKFDLENIDSQIEETLSKCEDARYNVAQGYTVFKKLKELRNERKEILLELEKVQAIAGRFDCDAMRKKYEEIESCLLLDFEDTTPATGDDQPVPAAV